MKKQAAFFDFDGTIIRGESSKYGTNFLFKKGLKVSPSFILKTFYYYLLYKTDIISEENMTNLLLSFYKGKKLNFFTEVVPEFYEEYIIDDLFPKIVEITKEHKKNGRITVIASASLCYFMEYIKERLDFDYALCTELKVDHKGILTGESADGICIGEKKKNCVIQFSKKYNINLSESFGYGNHHKDIPFLEIVGHPVAVNPNRKLKETAYKNGWDIIKG